MPAPRAALAQKSFVRDDLASEGVRLEEKLRTEAGATAAGRPAAQLRRDAEAAHGPRRTSAARSSLYAAAVALEPSNAANWVGFARAVKAITPKDYSERYELRSARTAAAYIAYQRATTRPDEARGAGAARRDLRHARGLAAGAQRLSASLQLADEPALRKTYEELREKRGFRITDYKVDSDSASPRVCFQFSEPLAAGRVDFAPFVAVSGAANAAVTTESSQLCVDGLKHGERYAFVLRQGLPSVRRREPAEVGRLRGLCPRPLARRCASPAATTSCRAPARRASRSSRSTPPGVEVEVYRIGDRNLLPTVRSEDFLGQLSRYAAEKIAHREGRQDLVRHARDEVRAQPRRGHGLPGDSRPSASSSPASTS